MKIRDLKFGDKFRVINHPIFDLPMYIYLGVKSGYVEVLYHNSFRPCSWSANTLEHDCELVDEKPHASEKTYIERQRAWIEEAGLKVGDTVRVLRNAQDFEDGWDAVWDRCMYSMVGQQYKVEEIDLNHDGGIRVNNWYLPYFVLEKVETIYKPFTYEDRALFMGRTVEHKTNKHTIIIYEATPMYMAGYSYATMLDEFVWAGGRDKGKPVGVESL